MRVGFAIIFFNYKTPAFDITTLKEEIFMNYRSFILMRVGSFVLLLSFLLQPQSSASALTTLTLTPITWNVIGLDSNNVNVGPNHFPVAVRVCNTGSESATNVTAVFNWDSSNPYINIRPSTLSSVNVGTLTAGACACLGYWENISGEFLMRLNIDQITLLRIFCNI